LIYKKIANFSLFFEKKRQKNVAGMKKVCNFAHPFEREGVLLKGSEVFLEILPV